MSHPPNRHHRRQPQGQPPWDGYPPQGGQPGYPPTGQPGYPPQGRPHPSSGRSPWESYPPPGQPAYPPPPGQGGYPPPSQFPWDAYTPPGQQGYQSPGQHAPKLPHRGPPGRKPSRRKRLRKRNAILLAVAAIFLIAVISKAAGSTSTPTKPTAAVSAAATDKPSSKSTRTSSTKSKAISAAEASCEKRGFASGDIYLRMVQPGEAPVAQQLGGEWEWDNTTSKCLTSVQLMIATAPLSAGNCTQVGYVADNSGYNPNATVAAPLTHVVAQAGPACPQPAAATPPAQSTPAAPPAPPASTAPAGCSPLSDEGTCYKPGEYCRDDDHGASGVAGDGESIICEDNDGWRWEPA